jgi:chaperonin GroEL (HSP60 family)
MGVNVFTGKIMDMYGNGVIEPLSVKEQAIKSATEAASMILRIDDVIAATKPKEEKGAEKPKYGEYGGEY